MNRMSIPDWRLPPGVTRSVWEFAHDRQIARDENQHLAGAPLLEFDRRLIARWFTQPGRLVDLGCGTGRALVYCSLRGIDCVGVDLSSESLSVAAEATRETERPVALVRGNLCELDCLADGQFDYALMLFGTLGMIAGREHRRQALTHARRLLRPRGLLALHVHNLWRQLHSPQGRRWLARDVVKRLFRDPTAGDSEHDYRGIPRMYHHAFTSGEIRRLLQECKFRVLEMIPLAPLEPGSDVVAPTAGESSPDFACRGFFPNLRATGWMLLAEAA
jgi:ubiquinone/menaquinone biosynthesis C-methylase UbiE